jgi:para-aminobenzoate synthetase/4-amino-4-deoxychorismate lyase
VRLLLDEGGAVTVSVVALGEEPATANVHLSTERTFSGDVFLRHKTTRRELYEREYARARVEGLADVIFMNERGEVTEGAISNVFIRRDGKLLTPPLRSGVLPGVFRRHLLETDASVEERVLTLADFEAAESVFLGNSVRGLREVMLVKMGSA